MMHPMTLLLGPALLYQGRKVRREIVILPEAQGPRSGGTEGTRLLLIGDSSAAGVGVDQQSDALMGQILAHLPDGLPVQWQIEAKSGRTTPDTIQHLQNAQLQPADIVISALGVNDITAGTSVGQWIEQQDQLHQLLRQKLRPRAIIVSGLPPVGRFPALPNPLRWYLGRQGQLFDRRLKCYLDQQPDCQYLPLDFNDDPARMATDGFHPGPWIYAEWGKRVAGLIMQAYPVPASLAAE